MAEPVLVVGAGPAGLAATLRRRGIDALVVDRGTAVGDTWRARYVRLHLHTPRVQSAVHRLERDGDEWVAQTDDGKLRARQVVLASGFYSGVLLHSSACANPAVPAWLADPLNGFLQRRLVGHLTRYGPPAARQGVVAQQRATGGTPTIDVGLIAALKAGRVTPVPAVERFDGRDVVLADGTRLQPDVVLAATGHSTGLAPVAGHLGVLDGRGRPLVRGARTAPAAPGLRFVGLSSPLKGLLFQISLDARAAARAIDRELRRS